MATLDKSPGPSANNGQGNARDDSPRVLIASDVRLYREGLATTLADLGRLTIVGAVAGSDLTFACLSHFRPDVVLLDMALSACLGLPAALRADPRLSSSPLRSRRATTELCPARRRGSLVMSGKTVPLRTSS